MTKAARPLAILIGLCWCMAIAPATRPAWVGPADIDVRALLGDPPADDSAAHQREVDRMLMLQAARTPAQERRCKAEETVTAFAFADVLGPWFTGDGLPVTARLMADAEQDGKAIANKAKWTWNRVRPPLADRRIHPCVALERTPSYPSGHALRGVLWATLLAEIFPDRRDALMARGRQIGEDRVVAGMHYPSDVAAGQKLGAEVARRLLANADFRAALQKSAQECHAAAPPAKVQH